MPSPNETVSDLLTNNPMLSYIGTFLTNPYPLMNSLNRNTRNNFKKDMSINLFIQLRFGIPEFSELKCTDRELINLLSLSYIRDPVQFFCALATDVLSNGLYPDSQDTIFKYLLGRYNEFPREIQIIIEERIEFRELRIRFGDYKVFHDQLKMNLGLFFTEGIQKYPEIAASIYKEIVQNAELLNFIKRDFDGASLYIQISVLANLIVSGVSRDFYMRILEARDIDFNATLIDFVLKSAIMEDEHLIEYKRIEEIFDCFEQNRANEFRNSSLELLRIQMKIAFGIFETEHFNTESFNAEESFRLAEIASFSNQTELVWKILNNSKIHLFSKVFGIIANQSTGSLTRFVYKTDRFLSQLVSVLTEGQKRSLIFRGNFITRILRNYSLNHIDRTDDGDIRIVFTALEDRFNDGFPNFLEFLIRPERMSWTAVVLNIKESTSSALLSMWTQLFAISSSTTFPLSSHMLRMLAKYDNVMEFVQSHNVKLELSLEDFEEFLKMPCNARVSLPIMASLQVQNIGELLLSVKSTLELQNLEAITNDSIDSLYFKAFADFEFVDESVYFKLRPVIKYWIKSPFKESIRRITSDNLKLMIKKEFPDEMAIIMRG